ncbi:YkvA family protein [Rhizobium leguminosarum]|uniref:YkvA family protein n=1 Tax=Rhizobium leguminosarum TaxID=384 RepID=UPI003F9CAC40
MQLISKAKIWAKSLKRDIVALWLAARDARVPWHAKAVAGAVAAYALSPIDLIPILGYLDDLLIVPLGIMLAIRLVPVEVMNELRTEATRRIERPSSWVGLIFILAVWLICIIFLALALRKLADRQQ